MTATADSERPECPICGAACCLLARQRPGGPHYGETCGFLNCAATLRAQRLGPAHYRKLQAAAAEARKPRQWSAEYEKGYRAGYRTGVRQHWKRAP